jgi:hypothetical protein
MKTLSQRETHLVSGAGTDDEEKKMYAADLKQMMKGKTPAQIARMPGFNGANQYGGVTFKTGRGEITIGGGVYKLDSNPPVGLPSVGVDVRFNFN